MTLQKTLRKIRRAVLRDEPGYYDMYENEGERFYARLYLDRIERALAQLPGKLKILDAGCQSGRLAIPLARAGREVTGVDTSGLALHKAARHARAAGARLKLVRADMGKWLPAQPAGSFDAVVCTEVLYLRENHLQLLDGLVRVLRPGGLCFISHRPPIYYMMEAFQHGDWDAARSLLGSGEGKVLGSYYNWQTKETLERMYAERRVRVLEVSPIGLLSWLGTPPDSVDEAGRELLLQAELALMGSCPDTGRYLLVTGRKEA